MHVTTADFIKNYGRLADVALSEPVTITKNGHDRLVVISASEYVRLKGGEGKKPAPGAGEMPDEKAFREQMRESAVVSTPPDMSAEARLRAWNKWAHKKRPYTPPLSDEAISRASMNPDRW